MTFYYLRWKLEITTKAIIMNKKRQIYESRDQSTKCDRSRYVISRTIRVKTLGVLRALNKVVQDKVDKLSLKLIRGRTNAFRHESD